MTTINADKIEHFKKLRRVNDSDGVRWYCFPGDELRPSRWHISVTNAIGAIMPQGLLDYMRKTPFHLQEKRRVSTADIGTAIHALIEQDLNGVACEVAPEYADAFASWQRLRAEYAIQAEHNEIAVASEEFGFAGTIDIVGRLRDEPSVMDVKTGMLKEKAGWQLAAYTEALIEANAVNAPMPSLYGIQVHRDGAKTKVLPFDYANALLSFMAVLHAWREINRAKLEQMNWQWLHTDFIRLAKEGRREVAQM